LQNCNKTNGDRYLHKKNINCIFKLTYLDRDVQAMSRLKILRKVFASISLFAPKFFAKRAVNLFYTPRKMPAFKLEKRLSDSAKTYSVNTSEGNINVYHWGEEFEDIVFFIHGWEGRGTQVHKFLKPLLEKNIGVVAFDGPAHGKSEGKQTTLPKFSEAANDVFQSLDNKGNVYILAHSFGVGAAALAIKSGLKPKKAVFIAPPYSVQNVVNNFARFLHIPEKVAEYMHDFMETKTWHNMERDKLCFITLAEYIDMPLLIIHDKEDRYIAYEDGVKVHELCENSQMISTTKLGHTRILSDRTIVDKTVNFLIKQ